MNADQTTTTGAAPVPTAFADLVTTGREALAAGDLDTARRTFETAAEQFPDEPIAHNNLGAFYMGLGEYAGAEACFERVVELMPDNANSAFNLAVARFRQQHFESAATAFARVAELTPEDPEVHNNLGASHFMAGNFAAAREGFLMALQRQSNFPNAVLNLCDLELDEGNLDAARNLCEAYLAHNHDTTVLRRLLEILDHQARHAVDTAIPHAEAIIAASDKDQATRRHLGRLLEARHALTAEG